MIITLIVLYLLGASLVTYLLGRYDDSWEDGQVALLVIFWPVVVVLSPLGFLLLGLIKLHELGRRSSKESP